MNNPFLMKLGALSLALLLVIFLTGCPICHHPPDNGEVEGEVEGEAEGEEDCVCDTICFARVFGGAGSQEAADLVQIADGGYVLGGHYYDESAKKSFGLIVKTNEQGQELWSKILEHDGMIVYLYSLCLTLDGNIAMAGTARSIERPSEIYIYLGKIDGSGNLLWSTVFEKNEGCYDVDVQPSADGGLILCGSIDYISNDWNDDAFLLKTDGNGVQTWFNLYDIDVYDDCNAVALAPDGGYVITGETRDPAVGPFEVYALKTDAMGVEQWLTIIEATEHSYGYDIKPTSDSGYILAGTGVSFHEYEEISPGLTSHMYYKIPGQLIKLDGNGQQVWSTSFGKQNINYLYAVVETDDGGFLTAGRTKSWADADSNDVVLFRTDSQGIVLWSQEIGQETNGDPWDGYLTNNEWAYGLIKTADGGFALAGSSDSYGDGSYDMYLVKTNACGFIPEPPAP